MYVFLFDGRQKVSTNIGNPEAYDLWNQKRIKGAVMKTKK